MELIELLEEEKKQLIENATMALERSHLTHYNDSGTEVNKNRLDRLFDFVIGSIKDQNLIPLTDYIQGVATDRFNSGFSLNEVHTAINVMEEVIWEEIISKLEPLQLAEALRVVSRTLGAAKTSLGNTYISLATKGKAPTINVSKLFGGTEGD